MHASAPARRRSPRPRAAGERITVHRILDAGWIAHVGFSHRGQPWVAAMPYARQGDALLLRPGPAGPLLGLLGRAVSACVSVAIVDGLVLGHSQFGHGLNQRTVVAFGQVASILDPDEKAAALARLVDARIPGRAAETRPPSAAELAALVLLRFAIEDATAGIRSGPPLDAAEDQASAGWAGDVPLRVCYEPGRAAPDLLPGRASPNSLRRLLGGDAAMPG